MKTKRRLLLVLVCVLLAGVVSAADAPPAETATAGSAPDQPAAKHDATELAKQTQNPVANLISLPFQNNTFFEVGPKGKTQNQLLIQPIIPFKLNDDWNFIARPIIPIINQPPLTDDQNRHWGLGNVQFEGFFSPKDKVGDWIIAFGPILEFPTNSNPDGQFGTDNYSAGPAFLGLQMKGPWVYGALVNHLWSYHGNDPEVNRTFLNPFINYNLKDGFYVQSAPILTANWSADSSNIWTVPIGGGVGKVFHVGKLPINARLGAYYNIESPDTGGDWQMQVQVQFLFPK